MKNLKFIFKNKAIVLPGIILGVLIIVTSFLSNYPIKLIEYMVNIATNKGAISTILKIGGIYLVLQVVRAYLYGKVEYISTYLQQKIGSNIQELVYGKLLSADLRVLEEKKISNLTNTLIEDTQYISDNLVIPMSRLLTSIVSFCFGLYFMLTINKVLPLLIIPLGLITAIIGNKIQSKTIENTEDLRANSENLWRVFEEGIRGIIPIRLFRFQKKYNDKVNKSISNLVDTNLKQGKLNALTYFALSSLFMITIGGILIASSVLVVKGKLSIGGLTAIMMYNHMLVDPLVDSLELYRSILKLNVSLKRINGLLDIKKDEMVEKELVDIDYVKINNLSYFYDNKMALDGINLELKSNMKLAIVGESGSGKTTLAKLISGLYYDESNSIKYLFNGKAVYGIPKTSYLIQDGYLFDENIRDNILKFNNIDEEQYKKILDLTKIKDLDERFSETTIGEAGNFLSGGERKKVQLARTIARKDKSLYLFDELTSALDKENAREVILNTLNYLDDKMCIFIEHNVEYTKFMDFIIVMKDGKIIESGNYDELMSKNGYFKKLNRMTEI